MELHYSVDKRQCTSMYVVTLLFIDSNDYFWCCVCFISSAYYQGHDSGGECNVPYINRFAMPRPGTDQPW